MFNNRFLYWSILFRDLNLFHFISFDWFGGMMRFFFRYWFFLNFFNDGRLRFFFNDRFMINCMRNRKGDGVRLFFYSFLLVLDGLFNFWLYFLLDCALFKDNRFRNLLFYLSFFYRLNFFRNFN